MKKYLLLSLKTLNILILLCFTFSTVLVVANLGFIPLKYRAFAVASRSMYPVMEKGDLIFADRSGNQTYNVGDIAVFEEPGYKNRFVVHRIVESTEPGYITRGDNNAANDNWVVNQSSIQGKYIKKIAKLGDFLLFLRTLPGIIIFIVIPVIYLVALEVNVIINEVIEHRMRKAAKPESVTSIK